MLPQLSLRLCWSDRLSCLGLWLSISDGSTWAMGPASTANSAGPARVTRRCTGGKRSTFWERWVDRRLVHGWSDILFPGETSIFCLRDASAYVTSRDLLSPPAPSFSFSFSRCARQGKKRGEAAGARRRERQEGGEGKDVSEVWGCADCSRQEML